MAKLSEDIRSCLREFAWSLANGSLDMGEDLDYRHLLQQEPAFIENVFALWANVLEVDEKGRVINDGEARTRVEQYIRTWLDKDFKVDPPFESWEFELH
jgi:hypothetical protein